MDLDPTLWVGVAEGGEGVTAVAASPAPLRPAVSTGAAAPRAVGAVAVLGRIDNAPGSATDPHAALAAIHLWLWARYRRDGAAAFSALKGVFAVGIADFPRQRVWLYRSPLVGVPFVYGLSADCLSVAREAHQLIRRSAIDPVLDDAWLASYFALAPAATLTPFRGVRELLPGELLEVGPGQHRLVRSRPAIGQRTLRYARLDQYVEHFDALVHTAVSRAATGLDRLGLMLSGGLDSVPAAYWLMRERADAATVRAYAWSLPGFAEADESSPIRQSAASLGMDLQLFDGRAFWPLRDPDHWPLCPSTPEVNGFRLLKSALYRLAANDGCQAVVNGHYGDRLYPHYHHVLADALADRRLAEFGRELGYVLRRSGALGLHRHPAVRRVAKRALGRRDVWQPSADALTPDARRLMQGLSDWPPEADEHPRPDHYRALLGAEVAKGVNGEQFFTAQYGLDWVEPYIDWDLVDFVLSVPAYVFWNRGETKVLMRRAMRGRIPETVRTAPRTGLLGEFFHYGVDQSMAWIKRRLAGREVDWPRFVERRVVERICESQDRNDRDRLLVLACVAYEMWLDRYFR